MLGRLVLKDGTVFEGRSFGKTKPAAGGVVFATGLVGNYGVPEKRFWESSGIKVSGLVVSRYIDTPSHYSSKRTLAAWLAAENIPALEIKDTRALTKKLRTQGVMLGKIVLRRDIKS